MQFNIRNIGKTFAIWLLFNLPIFAILTLGFITGFLKIVFNDVTYITHFIFLLTLLTVFYTGYTSHLIDNNWNIIKFGVPVNRDEIMFDMEKLLQFPKFMMNFVITLGFLGTIIGVIIGFQTFPEGAFTDAIKMQEFVRQMLVGFSTELNSLLMGVFGKTWLSIIVYFQTDRLKLKLKRYIV